MSVLRESPWYQEILEEGMQIGEQQGRQEEKMVVAINLLSMGLTAEQIAQATGLTIEQVQQLQAA
ncbi:MAG: hypothetical protein HC925_09475 [Coleofasciculaceae cyanobacterium SM2_3_26]|nr:hypothetical protein [Coleofasciculaceae cyanobacterium SM2_3_26]